MPSQVKEAQKVANLIDELVSVVNNNPGEEIVNNKQTYDFLDSKISSLGTFEATLEYLEKLISDTKFNTHKAVSSDHIFGEKAYNF